MCIEKTNKTRNYFLGALTATTALLGSHSAHAGLIIDQDMIYYSGSLSTSGAETTSRILGGVSFGATFPKFYVVGWNINYVSRSDGSTTGTESLSGIEMGPRFGLFLGKSKNFIVALTYHPLVNSTYTSATGTSESWQGTGFQGELGYMPQVTSTLAVGFKLIYDSVSYTKSTNTSNTTSTISYSTSTITPTISLSWRF